MKAIISIILIIAFSQCLFAGLASNIDKGNRFYNTKQYDKALKKYSEAQIDDPASEILHYNMGSALYEFGKHEEALKEYEKATYSKDIKLQAKSYYNMGNALYRMGKLPESILYYKRALELAPDDEDAKYNVEFVQRKLKENLDKNKQVDNKQDQQQQDQQQQDQQQQDQQQQDQQQQDQQQQDQQSDRKDDEKKNDKDQEKDKKGDEKSEEDKEKDKKKQEALNLLDNFDDQEKKARDQMRKKGRGKIPGVKKDW